MKLWMMALALAACGDGPAPTEFAGSYEVPVAAQLSAAARFPVARVEWRVDGGTARLSYYLPLGLVGKSLGIRFDGAYDGMSPTVSLAGDAGTAECTVGIAEVSCRESLNKLAPIGIDLGAVATMATDYAGPAADRIAVAKIFDNDPIGIAHVYLTTPTNP